MGDIFYGWRRKVGSVTLGVTLLLTGAWVRSQSVEDHFSFVAFQQYECFASAGGKLEWASWKRDDLVADAPYPSRFWTTPAHRTANRFERVVYSTVELVRDFFVPAHFAPRPNPDTVLEHLLVQRFQRYHSMAIRITKGDLLGHAAIPYALIVLPLIVLSANLLFFQPGDMAAILRKFLRGPKRKAGIVTLLMTITLASGWVKSFEEQDEIVFMGVDSHHRIVSKYGSIGWASIRPGPTERTAQYWSAERLRDDEPPHLRFSDWTFWLDYEPEHIVVNGWMQFGFGVAFDQQKLPGRTLRLWIVPYWSIVIPSTLLSAYLLIRGPSATSSDELSIAQGPQMILARLP